MGRGREEYKTGNRVIDCYACLRPYGNTTGQWRQQPAFGKEVVDGVGVFCKTKPSWQEPVEFSWSWAYQGGKEACVAVPWVGRHESSLHLYTSLVARCAESLGRRPCGQNDRQDGNVDLFKTASFLGTKTGSEHRTRHNTRGKMLRRSIVSEAMCFLAPS